MAVVFNAATATNVSILQQTNSLFQISQKRVSTGKQVFGAADDATRYKMSETMLSRSRQLDAVNNNISIALKTLETTDKTLKTMISLVESAQGLIRAAQSEGAAAAHAVVTNVVAVMPKLGGGTNPAGILADSIVQGAVLGSKISITSDNGKNWTYTFGANFATTTWGDLMNSLNAANIGVTGQFLQNNQLQIGATDGKTDFTFDGLSDRNVMDDLTGISSASDGALAAATDFAAGAAVPAATELGMVIGYGGGLTTNQTGSIVPGTTKTAVNSSFTFIGSDGVARTWANAVAQTFAQVAADVNAMKAGVKAEFVNVGGITQMRLRNTDGGEMKVLNGAGSFAYNTAAGATSFRFNTAVTNPVQSAPGSSSSSNNAKRLAYGQQYDAIVTNLGLQISNNPVAAGRNLLQNQGMNIVMDEFAGNPIAIAGVSLTTGGYLGMTTAGVSWNTDGTIQNSATEASGALVRLRDLQANFATFNTYMQERHALNKSYGVDLKTLGDDLVAADVSEESAKLSALQTQQQFAVQAFSMGTQNAQGLLRLLG